MIICQANHTDAFIVKMSPQWILLVMFVNGIIQIIIVGIRKNAHILLLKWIIKEKAEYNTQVFKNLYNANTLSIDIIIKLFDNCVFM